MDSRLDMIMSTKYNVLSLIHHAQPIHTQLQGFTSDIFFKYSWFDHFESVSIHLYRNNVAWVLIVQFLFQRKYSKNWHTLNLLPVFLSRLQNGYRWRSVQLWYIHNGFCIKRNSSLIGTTWWEHVHVGNV